MHDQLASPISRDAGVAAEVFFPEPDTGTGILRRLDAGLEAGSPQALGPNMCVAFSVRRLPASTLAWINTRWFLENGVDVLDAGVLDALTRDLLERYGVCADDGQGGSQLFADRYGGTGGAFHGGSGRCGILGGFNAKGIGRTPLVSPNVDKTHSTGVMTLNEAIKEVIDSEVAAAELPTGAVPILAVIETGEYTQTDAGPERCAIVVRPNFIRPAHFERSIFFGDSGTPASAQFIDALRVCDATRAISARRPDVYPIEDMAGRVATQVGAAWALRLFQGQFLTSNVTVDGAMVDFGAFRSVPSWRRIHGMLGECFGNEGNQIAGALDSLYFYFSKYVPARQDAAALKDIYANVLKAADRTFQAVALRALGVDPAENAGFAKAFPELISAYFRAQQTTVLPFQDRGETRAVWIYDTLAPGTVDVERLPARERDVTRQLASLLQAARSSGTVSLSRAANFFSSRPWLTYTISTSSIRTLIRKLPDDLGVRAEKIARFVNRHVSCSRRYWPLAPGRFDIHGQVSDLASSALYGFDRVEGRPRVWLEGTRTGGGLYLFGRVVPRDVLADSLVTDGGRGGIFADAAGLAPDLVLPPPAYAYPAWHRAPEAV
ncbi:protein adenylyltransferase SelO family protein [Asticcacaulis solisilvae]|uniref:protein adenylyltransferase SelO family protein n=1 Tax=Asticcacaulis solisilvae TaxID=1217274 RepID=UPI003FD8B8DC